MEDELMTSPLGVDESPILPDGWQPGEPLFSVPENNEVEAFELDGVQNLSRVDLGNEMEDISTTHAKGDVPATDSSADGRSADGNATGDSVADGQQAQDKRHRILQVAFNHQTEAFDFENATDAELIEMRQKAKAFDSWKDDTRKAKYREVYNNQIDNYGMSPELARVAAREAADGHEYSLTDEPETVEQTDVIPPSVRDFSAELNQVRSVYPDATSIPDEVIVKSATDGTPLLVNYAAYREAQRQRTVAENRILKQNAATAAKAPVKGVTGGGDTKPQIKTPFEIGFDSDNW